MRTLAQLTADLSHRGRVCEIALRLTAVERAALRLSRGRWSVSGVLGVPVCLLRTRGARTGRARAVPVVCTRVAGGLLVLGSNGGRPEHPQWTHNLRCDPRAEVTFGGATTPVRAELLTGAERAALWPLACAAWPPYETYQRRSGRTLRMFRLRPAEPGAQPGLLQAWRPGRAGERGSP